MPNWTGNTITLRGSKEKLAVFKQKVAGENGAFDFNKLIPMPKELRDTLAPTEVVPTQQEADERNAAEHETLWKKNMGVDGVRFISEQEAARREKLYGRTPDVGSFGNQPILNWYDWARKNWGTKWNACEVEVEEYKDTLTYRFDTAWDCPRPLIKPIVSLAHELGLSIIWSADHEDGGYEDIFDSEMLEDAA